MGVVTHGQPQAENSKWKIPEISNSQFSKKFFCNILFYFVSSSIAINLILCLIYKLNFVISMSVQYREKNTLRFSPIGGFRYSLGARGSSLLVVVVCEILH